MEIYSARPGCIAGAVTLAPHGVGGATLPDSISTRQCPVGYSTRQVLVTNLAMAVEVPQDVVNDVLIIDDLLRDHS